jgi:hypothetical protein
VNADVISTFAVGEEVKVNIKDGDMKNVKILKFNNEKSRYNDVFKF